MEEWGDILGGFLGGQLSKYKSKKKPMQDDTEMPEGQGRVDWTTWNPIYDDDDPTNDLNSSPSYSDRMMMRDGYRGHKTDTFGWRRFINGLTGDIRG